MTSYLSMCCFTLIKCPDSKHSFNSVDPIIKPETPSGKLYVISGMVTEDNYSSGINNEKIDSLCVLQLKYENEFLYPTKNWIFGITFRNPESDEWVPLVLDLSKAVFGDNYLGIIDQGKQLHGSEYQIALYDPAYISM